jgi:hypothetical protein
MNAEQDPEDAPLLPEWAVEMEQHAREREDERHQILSDLEDEARQLGVAAVLPDIDDPLRSFDPTPESDREYPILSDTYWSTWRVNFFQDWVFPSRVVED